MTLPCLGLAAVDGNNLVRKHGLVRYTVTLTTGAKAIPQPANLTISGTKLAGSSVAFIDTRCTAQGGSGNVIDLSKPITSTDIQLTAESAIVCHFDYNVTEELTGKVPKLVFKANFTSAVDTDIQALWIDTAQSDEVEVFRDVPTWRITSEVISTESNRFSSGK